jgi:nucleotide-binding universal stress UspA family protein
MIERLLVPIDGGPLDERAIAVSVALARQLHAAIVGFIVEPFAAAHAPGGLQSEVSPSGTDAALQAHAQGVLARFAQLARDADVPFHGVATQASEISGAILDTAREHRCDMIVMATHGRGVIAELLWGSQTRDVMSRTDLPVLVLH